MFKKIILAIIVLIGIVSCSDREIITVDNQAAPIVINMSAESVFLDKKFPDNPALNITWNAAKYTVPVQVTYVVEISADKAFTKPLSLGTVTNSVSTITYTMSQLNAGAQAIGLVKDVSGTMYVRIKSYLGNNSASGATTSNVTSVMVTPYELDYPTFYLVGAASYVGWDSGKAQVLYKSANLSYIYTYMESGQSFRFLGQQNWNPLNYSISKDGTRDAYKYFLQVSSNLVQDGEENMKFTDPTGIYKVEIDAKTGVQSLTVSASPILNWDITNLYLVGTPNSWDAAAALTMTKTAPGIFEYTTTLADASEFKFIGQKAWGALEWGNIKKDNNGNSGFIGPKGDNGNIKFDGAGKKYKITVNLKGGIYTIVAQ